MTEGTFLVTHADAESAVLRNVADGQVHPLVENPGLEPMEVVEARLEPEPPLEVAWRAVEIAERWTPALERSAEAPTRQSLAAGREGDVGDLARLERAGTGEVHVLTVAPGDAEAAAADVLEDEETVARAARLGVRRVEVRTAERVVSVRYLP